MAKDKAIDVRHYDVIVAPHITEKATLLSEHNAVVFKVERVARPSHRSRQLLKPCSTSRSEREHARAKGQDQALEGQALHAFGCQKSNRHFGRRPVAST
jgi:hypothetical protein